MNIIADVKSIFGKAVDLPSPVRAAYLDEACAGNPPLRAEVESLLQAHEDASRFLQDRRPPIGATVDEPIAEQACLDCPELLPEVRRRRQEFYLIDAQVEALLPGLRTDQRADAVGPGLPSAGLPQVPGYEVKAVLGHGGMGVVYRATDRTLGREVAVKVLLARFAFDSGPARRFADEARITAQLQHPGIPPVHEVGSLPDGRPFLSFLGKGS